MSQSVNLIMSTARNGVIGNQGSIPWELPDEQKRFRTKTLGHVVVFGRKTWESLPFRPLAGRDCVVLSRQAIYDAVDAIVFDNIPDILKAYPGRQIWIAGGAEVFKAAQNYADEIHSTVLDYQPKGDARFEFKGDCKITFSQQLENYVPPGTIQVVPVYEYVFKLKKDK